MRLVVATAAAAMVAAVLSATASARVIQVTKVQPDSCGLGLTVDGSFVLLNGESGVIAETDVPAFPGAPFNVDQVFVCHGKTPPGLVSETMRMVQTSPSAAGMLLAHITVNPTAWTFAVVRTGPPHP
jgi:hypothetical protein